MYAATAKGVRVAVKELYTDADESCSESGSGEDSDSSSEESKQAPSGLESTARMLSRIPPSSTRIAYVATLPPDTDASGKDRGWGVVTSYASGVPIEALNPAFRDTGSRGVPKGRKLPKTVRTLKDLFCSLARHSDRVEWDFRLALAARLAEGENLARGLDT